MAITRIIPIHVIALNTNFTKLHICHFDTKTVYSKTLYTIIVPPHNGYCNCYFESPGIPDRALGYYQNTDYKPR